MEVPHSSSFRSNPKFVSIYHSHARTLHFSADIADRFLFSYYKLLLHTVYCFAPMAGPNEDWLVWDRRFQFGYSCLNQRLKTTEGATQQQLALLDQQIKEMAASNKHLQEDNSSLRDRIQQLEQTSDRTAQHDEQIQDLTASSGDLKGENNGLKDRMLQVEQEGIHRDQENQLVREQLKEELSALKTTVKCLGTSIKGMNEIARAERAQRGDEIRYLRSQVKDLVATKHTAEGYPRDSKSRERAVRRSVSNIWYSSKRYIPGYYRGRGHTTRHACRATAGRSPKF